MFHGKFQFFPFPSLFMLKDKYGIAMFETKKIDWILPECVKWYTIAPYKTVDIDILIVYSNNIASRLFWNL